MSFGPTRAVAALVAALALAAPVTGSAQAGPASVEGRWVLEVKGGRMQPDLPTYQEFYGGKRNRHLTLAFAYRLNRWVETGAELGWSRDTGVGRLPSGDLGGNVTYTLMPAHAYVNFRWEPSHMPFLVPYAGVGLSAAHYRQSIALQSNRTGRTDLGTGLRAGLELSLDRLDPMHGQSVLKRTFVFAEWQRFTAEVNDIDLGGDVYLLGLRFEFGRAGPRHWQAVEKVSGGCDARRKSIRKRSVHGGT
jgi:hypothetical protein